MLYDKRWDKTETKADPSTLESLIAWLEKQPADREYCYMDNGRCLLGQYFLASGFSKVSVGGTEVVLNGIEILLSETFQDIAWASPRTFAGALDRARTALAR